MSNVSAYAGALVVGQPSQITLNDADQDGDLWNFPEIRIYYEDPGKTPKVEWPVVDRKPIITRWKDHEGHEHQAINSVVLLVIPKLPPPGCLPSFLARLVPSFLRRHGKERPLDDPPGTGTLTGTMNPPPPPPPPPMGPAEALPRAAGPILVSKSFRLGNLAIYHGIRV